MLIGRVEAEVAKQKIVYRMLQDVVDVSGLDLLKEKVRGHCIITSRSRLGGWGPSNVTKRDGGGWVSSCVTSRCFFYFCYQQCNSCVQ